MPSEKKKTKSPIQLAGLLLFNSQGQVAIVQQRNGKFSLPKGHIDRLPDKTVEAAHEAAVRETCEEIGVQSDSIELMGKIGVAMFHKAQKPNRKKDDRKMTARPKKVLHVYEAKAKEALEISGNGHDTVDALWLHPQEAAELLHPQLVAYLREHSEHFWLKPKEGSNSAIPYPCAEGYPSLRHKR